MFLSSWFTITLLLVLVSIELVGGYVAFPPQRPMLSAFKRRDSLVVLRLTTTDFKTGLTFELGVIISH